mmetsp:Transcript_18780/g.56720  ORF Transcript_18780/g.56720 Transcript_18780/m.56720 type:complete len:105 (-) Transcript_18780:1585-1899(-)
MPRRSHATRLHSRIERARSIEPTITPSQHDKLEREAANRGRYVWIPCVRGRKSAAEHGWQDVDSMNTNPQKGAAAANPSEEHAQDWVLGPGEMHAKKACEPRHA